MVSRLPGDDDSVFSTRGIAGISVSAFALLGSDLIFLAPLNLFGSYLAYLYADAKKSSVYGSLFFLASKFWKRNGEAMLNILGSA